MQDTVFHFGLYGIRGDPVAQLELFQRPGPKFPCEQIRSLLRPGCAGNDQVIVLDPDVQVLPPESWYRELQFNRLIFPCECSWRGGLSGKPGGSWLG